MKQDQFAYLVDCMDSFNVKGRRMADGVRHTQQESRSSQADLWRQRGAQLETVVQCQAYIRWRMQAPGRLVVEANDKHCDVSQEEYDDDCIKFHLCDTDHEGARRCAITGMPVGSACSLYCGTSTFCSEWVDHETVLMVKFMGRCVAIEQDGPFEEQKGFGRMKQNLTVFRNFSLGQKMCAIFGKAKVELCGIRRTASKNSTTEDDCFLLRRTTAQCPARDGITT